MLRPHYLPDQVPVWRGYMKALSAVIAIVLALSRGLAEPGGTYILTGKEKSIEEIVKADMEQHPELYKGESIIFYTAKFKQENNLGKRKTAPGEELIFPETKASIKAKKAAQRQCLIGKWRAVIESGHGRADRLCIIIEYREDGTWTRSIVPKEKRDVVLKFTSGSWEIKEGYLHVKDETNDDGRLPADKRKRQKMEVVLLSDTQMTIKNDKDIMFTYIRAEELEPTHR